MLTEETINKLHEMRLSVLANTLREQMNNPATADLSFEERFGMLVDSEWCARKSNRLMKLIRSAGYPIPGACVENIEYHPDRKLDKNLIARLATCSYISESNNVIILGATGVGKTYLACAMGMAANRSSYLVKYVRLPDLLAELAVAKCDGTYQKVLKQYVQCKALILDEWLLFPLKEAEARDMLNLLDSRHKTASTIFCSQFDVAGWHAKLGEPTLADAICDRIAHNSYTLRADGDSMRKRKGLESAVVK